MPDLLERLRKWRSRGTAFGTDEFAAEIADALLATVWALSTARPVRPVGGGVYRCEECRWAGSRDGLRHSAGCRYGRARAALEDLIGDDDGE